MVKVTKSSVTAAFFSVLGLVWIAPALGVTALIQNATVLSVDRDACFIEFAEDLNTSGTEPLTSCQNANQVHLDCDGAFGGSLRIPPLMLDIGEQGLAGSGSINVFVSDDFPPQDNGRCLATRIDYLAPSGPGSDTAGFDEFGNPEVTTDVGRVIVDRSNFGGCLVNVLADVSAVGQCQSQYVSLDCLGETNLEVPTSTRLENFSKALGAAVAGHSIRLEPSDQYAAGPYCTSPTVVVVDPENPDDDGDGVNDDIEIAALLDPFDPDTDGDGVQDDVDALPSDPFEAIDADGDGIGANSDFDDGDALVGYPTVAEALSLVADPQLAQCIADNAGDRVLARELSVIYCFGEYADIATLDGIRWFSGLQHVEFRRNFTSSLDISPLVALPLLNRLLFEGPIIDLEPLRGDTRITTFSLEGECCDFESIEPLSANEISVLQSMTGLTELSLSWRQSPLPDFSALTQLEMLSVQGPTDIGNAVLLPPSLRRLSFYNNFGLTDFTPLASLTQLTELRLVNIISEEQQLSVVAGLDNLELLELSYTFNNLSSLGALISADESVIPFPNLTDLLLGGNAIADFSLLSRLPSLVYLDVSRNGITDLSVLPQLPTISELNLEDNAIDSLDPLIGKVSNLRNLFVGLNRLSTLGDLSMMDPTASLVIGAEGNRIRQISSSLATISAGSIDVSNNPIECDDLALYQASQPQDVTLNFTTTCVGTPTEGGGIGRVVLTHTGESGFAVDDIVTTIDGVNYGINFDSATAGTVVTTEFEDSGIHFSVLSDNFTGEVVDVVLGNDRSVEDFGSSLPNALHIGSASAAIELEVVDPSNPLLAKTASAISMRLGDGDGSSESFKVEVFDADDSTLIDFFTYTTRWGVYQGGVAYGFDYANPGQAPPTLDTDGDGLADIDEQIAGTDQTNRDSDDDGLLDGEEADLGTDPLLADTDGDGLTDLQEVDISTDPLSADTDNDGLTDGDEIDLGTEPWVADTDGDGVLDGTDDLPLDSFESVDADGDGVGANADLDDSDASVTFYTMDEALVNVVDAQLRDCIQNNSASWREDGAILSAGDVRGLACGYRGYDILTLTGLESFPYLQSMGLRKNYNIDLSALPTLPFLTELAVDIRDGIDAQVVGGLSGLELLTVDSYENDGVDLSFISQLTNLHTLEILAGGNGDILPNIDSLLALQRLSIRVFGGGLANSIDFSASSTSLTSVTLGGAEFRDLGFLVHLPQLEFFQLEGFDVAATPLLNASALSNLVNVTYLRLVGLNLSAVPDLSALGALETLVLQNNQITDFSGLSGLSWLNALDLEDNQLTDLSVLPALSQVTSLVLRNNEIEALAPLETTFSDLRFLDISGNRLQTLGSLSFLSTTNLTLNLEDNRVRVVSESLANISEGLIKLDGNPVLCSDLDSYLASKPSPVFLEFNGQCLTSPTQNGPGIGRVVLTHTGGGNFAVDDIVATMGGTNYRLNFEDQAFDTLVQNEYSANGFSFSVLQDDWTARVVDLVNGAPDGIRDFGSSLTQALQIGGNGASLQMSIMDPANPTLGASAIAMRLGDGDGSEESFKVEVYDAENNNLIDIQHFTTNSGVYEGGVAYGFDYANPGQAPPTLDTDGDGLADIDEQTAGTDQTNRDSDDDGLLDGEEADLGTDPLLADTDGDGFTDGEELTAGSDPNLDSSIPVTIGAAIAGITDPVLRSCVESEVAESTVYASEVWYLSCIFNPNAVTDLAGLDAFENLEVFYLYPFSGSASDALAPLATLEQLRDLALAGDLPPLNPLRNKISLTALYLWAIPNSAEPMSPDDVEVIRSLSSLASLQIKGQLWPVLPDLSVLDQLELLGVQGAIDISAAAALPPSLRTFALENNFGLTDFTPLASLTQIEELRLGNVVTASEQLNAIAGLDNLVALWITDSGDRITDLDDLISNGSTTPFPNLKELRLRNNQLEDLSRLSLLPALTDLNLSRNNIADLSTLLLIPTLTSLNLDENLLESLDSLNTNYSGLTQLFVGDNRLTTLGDLSFMDTDLSVFVSAPRNGIRQISGSLAAINDAQIVLHENPLECDDLTFARANSPQGVSLVFDEDFPCVAVPTEAGGGIARMVVTDTGGGSFAMDNIVTTINDTSYGIDFDSQAAEDLITTQFGTRGVQFSVLSDNNTGVVVDLVGGNPYSMQDFGSSLPHALRVGSNGASIEMTVVDPENPSLFDTASAVTMRLGDGDGYSESFKVEVYDVLSNLIDIRHYKTYSGFKAGGVAYGFDYANPGQAPPIFDFDGDGVPDAEDAFKGDRAASADSDGDGSPDAWTEDATEEQIIDSSLYLDAFPNDLAASIDADSDGLPDAWNDGYDAADSQTGLVLDLLPNDTDNDGIDNDLDAFIDDPAISQDTDSDGYPDSYNSEASSLEIWLSIPLDEFPDDSSEWIDSDGDSLGNNIDPDDDNDGVDDSIDPFPFDAYPTTPQQVSSSLLTQDLVAVSPTIGPVGHDFVVDSGSNNWQIAPEGSYTVTQDIGIPALVGDAIPANRSGQWVIAENALWFDTVEEIGVVEYVQEEDLLGLPNYKSLQSPPSGQIALDTFVDERWVLQGATDGIYTFAIQRTKYQYLAEDDPWAEPYDPTRAIRVIDYPVTEQYFLLGASHIPWLASELVGETLAMSSTGAVVGENGGIACLSGADCGEVLEFSSLDAGVSLISDRAFTWAIDTDGLLRMTFGAGQPEEITFEVSRFTEADYAEQVLVTTSRNGTLYGNSESAAYRLDPVDFSHFVNKGLANSYAYNRAYAGENNELLGGYGPFLDEDGTGRMVSFDKSGYPDCIEGCRITEEQLTWTSDGQIISIDRYDAPEREIDRSRTWQLLSASSESVWVFETFRLEFLTDDDQDGVPDLPADIATRVNVYSITPEIDDFDLDGVPNDEDDFRFDPAVSLDTDGDGMPDSWNSGYDESDSTTSPSLVIDDDDDNDLIPDIEDAYPLISIADFVDNDQDGAPDVCTDDACELAGMSLDQCPTFKSASGCFSAQASSANGTTGDTVQFNLVLTQSPEAIEGIEFNVAFDPLVLQLPETDAVTGTGNPLVVYSVDNTLGAAVVAIAQSSPAPAVGELNLAALAFVVVSEATAAFESPVVFSDIALNTTAGVPVLQQGTFTFRPSIDVAGITKLWTGAASGEVAVSGVVGWSGSAVNAIEPLAFNSSADSGAYEGIVTALDGNLTFAPSSAGTAAISAFDASLVLQSLVGGDNWTWGGAMQSSLADVDSDGTVRALDASRILQMAVGNLQLPFEVVDGASTRLWQVRTTNDQSESGVDRYELDTPSLPLTSMDFSAGLVGDVSGNFSGAGDPARNSQGDGRSVTEDTVGIEIIEQNAAATEFTIAIYVSSPQAYGLDLTLTLHDLSIVQNFVPEEGWSYAVNRQGDSLIIGLAQGQKVSGDRILLGTLRVRLQTLTGSLRLVDAKINEADADVSDGVLEFVSTADSDGDGVLDANDQCPDSVVDATLDSAGCTSKQRDADNDGLSDYEEVNTYGTDPENADSDGDGWSDGEEVEEGSSPVDKSSEPIIQGLNMTIICAAIGCAR